MSKQLIERVAQAMRAKGPPRQVSGDDSWDDVEKDAWFDYAAAAIRAMRLPTGSLYEVLPETFDGPLTRRKFEKAWTRLIDAAADRDRD